MSGVHRFYRRLAILFAGLAGVAYGNPVPFRWTGLPALLAPARNCSPPVRLRSILGAYTHRMA
jgi:hypothetical protein